MISEAATMAAATDLELAMNVVRRAKWLHVDDVACGARIEFKPKHLRRERHRFSTDAASRQKQHRFLWYSAVQAFKDADVRCPRAKVRGKWLQPQRRRAFAETELFELRRLNDVLDRTRVGMLQALVGDERLPRQSSDPFALLKALASWDYPVIAELAEREPTIRAALTAELGITEDEYAAMACLASVDWAELAAEDRVFGDYYAG